MIAGKNEDIIAIDFEGNEDISLKYQKVINNHSRDNILFVCDLLGGTPYKEASKLAFSKPNVAVTVGCNLGSLLEISLIKDNFNLDQLTSKIISSSKKNVSILDKKKLQKKMGKKNEGNKI